MGDEVEALRAEVERLGGELRATRAVHAAAIESLPFDFWARDRDGVCVSENSTTRANWGSLLGKRPEDSDAAPEAIAVWIANNTRALGGEVVHGDVDYVVGGQQRHVHNIVGPIRQGDEIVGTFGVNIDLTELRRLERKVRETQRLETLGLFAGGVAHDINNIVMVVLGIASLARRRAAPGSSLDVDLESIETASRRAAAICAQLLAFAGKGDLAVARLELADVVAETLRLVAPSIPATIAIDVAAQRVAIDADAGQLRQLVMNLLLNASEAIGEHDGIISVRVEPATRAMLVAAVDDDPAFAPDPARDYAMLEVRDTGSGMTAPTRARIFEPFFTTKARGRGLGLAAVLGAVRAHGGGLHVETEPGHGSRFCVYLPRSSEGTDSAAREAPIESWRGSGTIVVVDDDEGVAVATARMLGELGFDPIVCRGGREAMAVFDERKHERNDVALVLLDLMMPGLDGAATLRALRAKHPHVRAVLMSGFHELAEPVAGVPVLAKPFSLDELARAVRAAISS
ncbi:MAG TPA: ATP-binding protein [Kofleriaceae bacterium]|jgi:signal transduction histidine kinase